MIVVCFFFSCSHRQSILWNKNRDGNPLVLFFGPSPSVLHLTSRFRSPASGGPWLETSEQSPVPIGNPLDGRRSFMIHRFCMLLS